MEFVFFLDTTQDGDGVFHARLTNKNRLEAPRQRGIFLHVFAIFIKRRGANAMQFAARQGGFEQV